MTYAINTGTDETQAKTNRGKKASPTDGSS